MTNVPKLKLTYFNFHGGRGEPARLALHIAGIPFEDHRIDNKDWPALKTNTPFGGLPVLEVDGVAFAQSNGVNRYVGKLTGLYPTDPLQAAFADEVMDAVEEIAVKVGATMPMKDEDKKREREKLAEGALPFYLRAVAARLAARGGQYFADNRLTVADLKVFLWVRHLKSGVLDYIPKDLADRIAPTLVEHFERIRNEPKIKEYYTARGVN